MGAAPDRERRATELATVLRLDRSDLTGELLRWARREILPSAWARKNLPITAPATYVLPEHDPADVRTRLPGTANSPTYALN